MENHYKSKIAKYLTENLGLSIEESENCLTTDDFGTKSCPSLRLVLHFHDGLDIFPDIVSFIVPVLPFVNDEKKYEALEVINEDAGNGVGPVFHIHDSYLFCNFDMLLTENFEKSLKFYLFMLIRAIDEIYPKIMKILWS